MRFPVLRYGKVISDWESEGYSEAVLRKVLSDNAKRHFGVAN